MALLLLTAACGKKEAPVEQATPGDVTAPAKGKAPEKVEPKALAAPKLFTDPQKQSRFENLFTVYQSAFNAPQPGMLIRAETKSGGRIDGEMVRYTDTGIIIDTSDGYVTVPQAEITEAFQQQLFPVAFSSALAEKQMAIDAAEGRPAEPDAVFFPPAGEKTIEVRRFTADRMAPRLGPGRHFATVEGAELFRGQNVFVVDEMDGWIAVKDTEEAPRAVGWIPRYSSFLANPENRDAVAREVDLLTQDGFIVTIDPRKNEALVDIYQWRISDNASVEGKSRLLAFYCGQQKGVRLYWVDIKDALTGRRLAEYSESKGFRVY